MDGISQSALVALGGIQAFLQAVVLWVLNDLRKRVHRLEDQAMGRRPEQWRG